MALINELSQGSLLAQLSGLGSRTLPNVTPGQSSINGRGVSTSFGSEDAAKLSDGLKKGVTAFDNSFLRLSTSLSSFRQTEATLKELLSLADDLIKIARQAADATTSGEDRIRLQSRFDKLAREFRDILDDRASKTDDILNRSDLQDILEKSGISTTVATRLAQAFERLVDVDGQLGFGTFAVDDVIIGTGGDPAATFQARTSYSTGDTPSAIATGDFNGDFILDIVTANDIDDTVSVLLGNGDGTFGAATAYSVGQNPQGITVGDLNGDDVLDIVAVDNTDNTISVLLGNGDGTFGSATAFSTGNGPQDVILGDFNGDNILDIVTADKTDNTVSVLLGVGDGTFGSATAISVGTDPVAVAVGYFDDNNKLDIVTADSADGTVSVLLGNGDGTFGSATAFSVGNNPQSIAIGDFDLDLKLDIVTGDNTDDAVSVLLGNGDGTFGTATQYTVGDAPLAVAVGDFDGDFAEDLISGNDTGQTVSVLFGNLDGTFQAATALAAGDAPIAVAVGDFDRDGALDFVSVADTANTLDVFLQNITASDVSVATSPSKVLNQNMLTRAGATLAIDDLQLLRDDIQRNLDAVTTVINELNAAAQFALAARNVFQESLSRIATLGDAIKLSQEIADKLRTRLKDGALGEHSDLDSKLVVELLKA